LINQDKSNQVALNKQINPDAKPPRRGFASSQAYIAMRQTCIIRCLSSSAEATVASSSIRAAIIISLSESAASSMALANRRTPRVHGGGDVDQDCPVGGK
jgi:hypothetical protein